MNAGKAWFVERDPEYDRQEKTESSVEEEWGTVKLVGRWALIGAAGGGERTATMEWGKMKA